MRERDRERKSETIYNIKNHRRWRGKEWNLLERPYISYRMQQLCWEKLVRGTYEICNRLQACACTRVDTRQAVRRVRVDLGGSWKLTGTDETIHRTATCYPYALYTSVFYLLLFSSLSVAPASPLARSRNYSCLVNCCFILSSPAFPSVSHL